jgi:hypothetical protein
LQASCFLQPDAYSRQAALQGKARCRSTFFIQLLNTFMQLLGRNLSQFRRHAILRLGNKNRDEEWKKSMKRLPPAVIICRLLQRLPA